MHELLPGEPEASEDPDEARRWFAAYLELTRWLEGMLAEDDMAPDLRARLSWKLLGWRVRFQLWERRAPGAGATPARRPVALLPDLDLDLDQALADRVEHRL